MEPKTTKQRELFGLDRLETYVKFLKPGWKRKLISGLLWAAAENPREFVAALDDDGSILLEIGYKHLTKVIGCSRKTAQRYRDNGLQTCVHCEYTFRFPRSEEKRLRFPRTCPKCGSDWLSLVRASLPVNDSPTWQFNLRTVLPEHVFPHCVTWYARLIETADPYHDAECDAASVAVSKQNDAASVAASKQNDAASSAASHFPETPENAGNAPPGAPLSYVDVTTDITSTSRKATSLPPDELEMMRSTFAAAQQTGVRTVGSCLTQLPIDCGVRSFAMIDFSDVLKISGREVDGQRWPLLKRQQILCAYFADACKANKADRSELRMFAAVFCLAARRKPNPPEKGEDERGGYLRKIWTNRVFRKTLCSKDDFRIAQELIGK